MIKMVVGNDLLKFETIITVDSEVPFDFLPIFNALST